MIRVGPTNRSFPEDLPVQSFRTLMAALGTSTKNGVRIEGEIGSDFYELTRPAAF